MFCPKCGSQNSDDTKFCRGCGADLGNVFPALASVGGKNQPATAGGSDSERTRALAEKHIDLNSSGLRGVIIGAGFLIVAGTAFGISERLAIMGLFMLAFGFYFLGTGISRLI